MTSKFKCRYLVYGYYQYHQFMKKFDDFYIKKFNKKILIEHNSTRHQYENSECGVYSINFILLVFCNPRM